MVNGRKYITVDGIAMLRAALGLPPLKKPAEFFGNFQGWKDYMVEARMETLRAVTPSMLEEYE